ncbi:MAG: DUF6776 family protein [Xanthomonadales bacterium]|nr:DUF6776 family protein [Xanthomonadales bacterium]
MNDAHRQSLPRPFLRRLAVLGAIALGLFLAGYLAGIGIGVPQRDQAVERAAAVEAENRRLAGQLQGARERATMSAREADVLRRANALMREGERSHQQDLAELRAELELYRRLGGATGNQAPLAVRHVELTPAARRGRYTLSLTLTQNLRWASDAAGRVELALVGLSDGAPAALDWAALGVGNPPEFRFKYFQLVERELRVPEGFAPETLELALRLDGAATPAFRERWPWQDLFAPAAGAAPGLD